MGRGDLPALTQLRLKSSQLESMRTHVEACLPLEGCGLLIGKGGVVQQVILVRNEAVSPVRFRMDPREQLHAFDRMDAEGLDLLAIFHSHPAGPAMPSVTDIAEAAYRVVYIVWSREHGIWQASGFWIDQGRISEVKLYAAGGE